MVWIKHPETKCQKLLYNQSKMGPRRVISFLSVFLALTFVGQLFVDTTGGELAQVTTELENDGEKEEVEDEKESDKLAHRQDFSATESLKRQQVKETHNTSNWVSPTLETTLPPPELV